MKLVHSLGKCTIYEVYIDPNDLPPFEESFLIAASYLNATGNELVYDQFIKLYGTHYFTSMHMGARYSIKYWFKRKSLTGSTNKINVTIPCSTFCINNSF